jgi:hypothetical protein
MNYDQASTNSAGSTSSARASFRSVVMRGSISSRSILATVAVVTPARLASSAWISARRVLCFFSLSPI